MNILEELKNRGILKDITNIEKFEKLSNESLYIGFDPTAESLHLGNYVQIAILKRFEMAGFKPIAVLGGATGMIGDPSGKSEERNLLSEETLQKNINKIKNQLESFGIEVFNNYEIYKDMNVLEFLREVGKLININYMLSKEIVSSRLEKGISFTEFSYQLIQGWDFKKLYDDKNVRIEIGGSDQWGNITAGVELIRKTVGDNNLAVGITTNLLTTKSGKKFGKSEGNAIWLDASMTTPYELYQYLISTPDEDLETLFNWLTFIEINEIKEIISKHNQAPSSRLGQKKLAFELTKDIHGIQEAEKAVTISDILFGSKEIFELSMEQALSLDGNVPTFKNIKGDIVDVIVKTSLAQSKREAREFLESGAISVNGKTVSEGYLLSNEAFDKKANIIKRGKKIILIRY